MKLERIRLDYGSLGATSADPKQRLLNNISALAQTGHYLWLASDEGDSIERLRWDANKFSDATSFSLGSYFPLPDGSKSEEVDVESLAIADDTLWVAASHSLVRRSPGKEHREVDDEQAELDPLTRLTKIRRRKRRFLFGKLPLSADSGDVVGPPDRSARCIPFRPDGSVLIELLGEDPHLSPFLALPDKENGLDIEGLAIAEGRAWLGLRGPTIRGLAVILELEPFERDNELDLRPLRPNGPRYHKHFFDLGGLGVRDLTADGPDIVILAGPTMGLAGPWAVLRWRGGVADCAEGIVDRHLLEPVLPLATTATDHPESIVKFRHPADGRHGWLVVYDHPDPARVSSNGVYQADFFF